MSITFSPVAFAGALEATEKFLGKITEDGMARPDRLDA
jgi:hypothetical protein